MPANMKRRVAVRARLGAVYRRMRANAIAGATAIEFALIAPIFLTLLFAIMETGIIYLAQSDLQNAVDNGSRLVLTGQAQSQNMSASDFRTAICNGLSMLGCNSNLQIDMESYGSFSGASYQSPLNADGTLNTNLNNYQPGISGQVVLLRATYTWPVATPLLTPFLSNMANNSHLITATAAFRNEPY
jgi:Flp pilus assembly protein TadG